MEDQRKRSMEALQRRFAQAEAEHHAQQQQNKKKRPPNQDNSNNNNKEIFKRGAQSPSVNAAKNHPTKASSPKSNITFPSHASKQETDPAYFKLSHSVDENLLPINAEACEEKTTVDRILHELFQHGDSAHKYMHGSKSMKIEHTILLDNFIQKSSAAHVQALPNGSKRSKKHMSLKQHKRIGSFDLPHEYRKYEIFKPMHEKWKSYVLQLLKITGKDNLAQCFLTADLHGALILVIECNIAAYCGIHGIMVQETKETFRLISEDNKFRVVPKKCSVFIFQADCWKITLHGDKLTSRNLVP